MGIFDDLQNLRSSFFLLKSAISDNLMDLLMVIRKFIRSFAFKENNQILKFTV